MVIKHKQSKNSKIVILFLCIVRPLMFVTFEGHQIIIVGILFENTMHVFFDQRTYPLL